MKLSKYLLAVASSAVLLSMAADVKASVADINPVKPYGNIVNNKTKDGGKWLPQQKMTYQWTGTDWLLVVKDSVKYNAADKYEEAFVFNCDSTGFTDAKHYIYTYGADGMNNSCTIQTKSDIDGEWNNSERYEYLYDEIIDDFIVQTNYYTWDFLFEDWTTSYYNSFYYDILRDNSYRVYTKTMYSSNASAYPERVLSYDYPDENSPASNLLIEQADENLDLHPLYYYTDMKWYKSDSQYLNEKDSKYFIFNSDLNNKIASFTLYTFDEAEDLVLDSKISNEWDDEGRIKMNALWSADGVNTLNTYRYNTTANGGYEYVLQNWEDKNGNKAFDVLEEFLSKKSEKTVYDYDDHGNEILMERVKYNVESKEFDIPVYKETHEYEYLDNYLICQDIHTTYSKGNEKSRVKTVYYDFKDYVPSSIVEVSDVKESSICRITDLQGKVVRTCTVTNGNPDLSGLAAGIYIIKNGSKIYKVVVGR